MEKPSFENLQIEHATEKDLSPDERIALSDQRTKASAAEKRLLLKTDLVIVPVISVAYLASYLVSQSCCFG